MDKCRQDLTLGQKFTTYELRLAPAVDELDGDLGLILPVRAPRTKYLTHPSSAKFSNNLVGADAAANPPAGEVLLDQARRRFRYCSAFEKALSALMSREQGLHFVS